MSAYYAEKIVAHGATPSGVDWNSQASQELRFEQLLKLIEEPNTFSLNDYGCGYGALALYLRAEQYDASYVGFDVSAEMLAVARSRTENLPGCRFVTDDAVLEAADYTVASGIMNVKLDVSSDAWEAHVLATLDRLNELSVLGFAFNVLTSYSDADRQRSDLYYADPCVLFDHCKRRYSRHVALLHDYGLYEFTVIVRKQIK